MSILVDQRIFTMTDAEASYSFGQTGSKRAGAGIEESGGFVYNSPSNVYSPPANGEGDVTLSAKFHQIEGQKTGLAGEQITANASPTTYGPDGFARIQATQNTLLTSIARLTAGADTLSNDYSAKDYFTSRSPRALRSYYDSHGSSDPRWQGGYDSTGKYPDRVTTSDDAETVAAPLDAVTTGLKTWLTRPGEEGQGDDQNELDPAFKIGDFGFESEYAAIERFHFLDNRKTRQGGNLTGERWTEFKALENFFLG